MTKIRKPNADATEGSGNVFADMGLPDADGELIKAQLASHIRETARGAEGAD